MVDIELKHGQTGYNAVGDYIRRYWEHNISDTVIVSLGVSYDGENYKFVKEVACPCNFDDIEFLYDWWEGQKYIKLFGIQTITEVDVSGGIYEK